MGLNGGRDSSREKKKDAGDGGESLLVGPGGKSKRPCLGFSGALFCFVFLYSYKKFTR